jgi:hypothetical protein
MTKAEQARVTAWREAVNKVDPHAATGEEQ